MRDRVTSSVRSQESSGVFPGTSRRSDERGGGGRTDVIVYKKIVVRPRESLSFPGMVSIMNLTIRVLARAHPSCRRCARGRPPERTRGHVVPQAVRRDPRLHARPARRSRRSRPTARPSCSSAPRPKTPKLKLFEFDVATGKTKELLSPETLLKGGDENLTPEEKARRERQRVSVGGFADYHLDEDGKHVLVTLVRQAVRLRPRDRRRRPS